jgi:hypothetical protein
MPLALTDWARCRTGSQRNQTATSARYREVQWSPPIDQANIEMNMPVQAGAEAVNESDGANVQR